MSKPWGKTTVWDRFVVGAGAGMIIAYLALIIGFFYGYIHNIVSLIGSLNGQITVLFIARCVGVIVVPLGAVLGYF